MGSSTPNCFVSRLPISWGTPVRMFIIARPNWDETPELFQPSSLCLPLTTALKGTMPDFTGITNVDEKSPETEAFLVGAKRFFQEPIIDDIVYNVRGKKVVIPKYDDKKLDCTLDLAFVREDVYQEIMRRHYDFRKDKAVSDYKIDPAVIAAELEIIRDRLVDEDTAVALHNKRFPEWKRERNDSYFMGAEEKMRTLLPLFKPSMERFNEEYTFKAYRNELESRLAGTAAVSDKAQELGMQLAAHQHFDDVICGLSILWQPSPQIAGQDGVFALHRSFAKAVGDISAAELQKRGVTRARVKKPANKP